MTARKICASALLALAPAMVVVTRMTFGGDTPDPMPTHWSLGGSVNGVTSVRTFFVSCLAVAAVAAAVGIATMLVERSFRTWRWACISAVWVGWLFASVYAVVVAVDRDAAVRADVPLGVWPVVTVVVLPIAVAELVRRLLPWTRPTELPQARPAQSLHLDETERIAWIGTTMSRPLLVAGTVATVAGGLLLVVQWGVGLAMLVVGLVLVGFAFVVVRADRRGLHVGFGPLHWPSIDIALGDVVSAEAEFIDPLRWGGWGYRITPRGRAVVLRRGEGLLVHRTHASDFVVTVDGAGEAADVVNALVSRRLDATRLQGDA